MNVSFTNDVAARAAKNTHKRPKMPGQDNQPLESKKIERLHDRMSKIREKIEEIRACRVLSSDAKADMIKELTESLNAAELEVETLLKQLREKEEEANRLNIGKNREDKRDTYEFTEKGDDAESAMAVFLKESEKKQAEAAEKAEETAVAAEKEAVEPSKEIFEPVLRENIIVGGIPQAEIEIAGKFGETGEAVQSEPSAEQQTKEQTEEEQAEAIPPGANYSGSLDKVLVAGAGIDEMKTIMSATGKLSRELNIREGEFMRTGGRANINDILKMREQIMQNRSNPLRGLGR
jgi:hypothetical protein